MQKRFAIKLIAACAVAAGAMPPFYAVALLVPAFTGLGAPHWDAEARGADGQSPVTVYAQDVTDNYEYSVIGAEQASDLIAALQEISPKSRGAKP